MLGPLAPLSAGLKIRSATSYTDFGDGSRSVIPADRRTVTKQEVRHNNTLDKCKESGYLQLRFRTRSRWFSASQTS